MKPHKGDWLLCERGHRAWLAISEPGCEVSSYDFVDKDGVYPNAFQRMTCPTCGGDIAKARGFGSATFDIERAPVEPYPYAESYILGFLGT